MPHNTLVPLSTIRKGIRIWIAQIPEGRGKSQLIRLGIFKGECIRCIEHLPGGTIVIEKGHREIAIGRPLAQSILVTLAIAAHQGKTSKADNG